MSTLRELIQDSKPGSVIECELPDDLVFRLIMSRFSADIGLLPIGTKVKLLGPETSLRLRIERQDHG